MRIISPALWMLHRTVGIVTLRQSLRIAFKDSFLCLRLPFIHYFCIQIKRLIFTMEFSALIKKEIMFKIWYLLCQINRVCILRLHINLIKDSQKFINIFNLFFLYFGTVFGFQNIFKYKLSHVWELLSNVSHYQRYLKFLCCIGLFIYKYHISAFSHDSSYYRFFFL